MLSNLPPGVTERMIPGNEPEDLLPQHCSACGGFLRTAADRIAEEVERDFVWRVEIRTCPRCAHENKDAYDGYSLLDPDDE